MPDNEIKPEDEQILDDALGAHQANMIEILTDHGLDSENAFKVAEILAPYALEVQLDMIDMIKSGITTDTLQ